jgi:putative redox protein
MVGVDSRGRTLVIGRDENQDPMWAGVKASDLLMLSAASCSMYDVVEILEKQREPLEDIQVECEADQDPDPPYRFTRMHLKYKVYGKISPEKLERAITLSQDKYCSVLATIRPNLTFSSEYEILQK